MTPQRALVLAALVWIGAALAPVSHAWAAPTFPPLTGRVVDNAHILSAEAEHGLDGDLASLERQTGRQLVVATIPDLQGYEIEDYGYQLGRTWALGRKGVNDGAILLVAPSERKVRIEVGYGLEPVLTDALSSMILQTTVLPRFREGNMEQGVVAGAEAIIRQLSLPDDQARAQVEAASQVKAGDGAQNLHVPVIFIVLIIFWVLAGLMGGFGGRRRGGLWWLLPLLLSSGSRGGGSRDGGFSGGGGSFGGGGSSGSW